MDCISSDIINAKLGTGRSSQGIEGYGGGPLWRKMPEVGCNANDGVELKSILLNIIFHAPMGRFHLELIYFNYQFFRRSPIQQFCFNFLKAFSSLLQQGVQVSSVSWLGQ